MSLSQLTSGKLAKLISLFKKKEKLQKQLNAVEARIEKLEGGKGKVVNVHSKTLAPRKGKRKRRGGMKAAILALLTAAGAKGLTVKEISGKIKKKPALVFAWYYASRAKLKGLKKVGPGRYAYKPAAQSAV